MTEKDILIEMARRGDDDASYRLGKLCADEENYTSAIRYYSEGVSRGNVKSMNALGTLLYTHGNSGRDKFRGLSYWYLAATNGYVRSLANIGLACFSEGKFNEAKEFWGKAAEQELPEAYHGLGKLAMRENDLDKAEEYLRKAADMGCAAAWNDLGILMQKLGRFAEARKCLEKAARNGYETAAANLERLNGKGDRI